MAGVIANKERRTPPPELQRSRKLSDSFEEYLKAMKRATVRYSSTTSAAIEGTPRERRRRKEHVKVQEEPDSFEVQQTTLISSIASMVPDEIIYRHADYSIRSYDTALMFIDVSGFTDLCEAYTNDDKGGPSRLTQVLNSYIGAMVQEILSHNGDVLKFSGDAFLSMWRKTPVNSMQVVVHNAIDCGLLIQKNYGRHVTDLGIVLKVKIAISAGVAHFALIGDENMSHYVLVGQPVWDVKMAEYMSTAGDVLTSASAWIYVNEAEYCTQPCGDGRHTKVLGIGAAWKRVDKIDCNFEFYSTHLSGPIKARRHSRSHENLNMLHQDRETTDLISIYREYSLRPAVIETIRSTSWPQLRRFMLTPVLRAVDNDEPLDYLSEIRHVVVVFLNIITQTVSKDVLIAIVDIAYRTVCSMFSPAGGLVNKVSMFDKDMMFLVVFGLRGLKHEDEAQKALLCAFELKETLKNNDTNITSVSVGVTSGRTYCGVVGHVLRREYTVIGAAVNKAARLMMAYPHMVTCDKETFVRSKLDLDFFRLVPVKVLKGIKKPGPVYEFNKDGWSDKSMPVLRHPLLGRNEELRRFKSVLQNAVEHERDRFTRYRDHKYAIAITGPRLVGKSRLMEEFHIISSNYIRFGANLTIFPHNVKPYRVTQLLLSHCEMVQNPLTDSITSIVTRQNSFENRLRYSLDLLKLSPIQLYALNTMFDCRFPLPENFTYSGNLYMEPSVREMLQTICKDRYPLLHLVLIRNAEFIDDESWRILIILLDTKAIFVVMSVNQEELLSPVGRKCLANNMIVEMRLKGIDRWYHAALACQLLDVQAIPSDLEKVIESASGGLPGWIQNFLISLIQKGQLTVVTVPRSEAVESGAIMPSPTLLTMTIEHPDEDIRLFNSSFQSYTGSSIVCMTNVISHQVHNTLPHNEKIQMAILSDINNFNNFENMKMDIEMDVIILQTYDSLSPFEKMLLKCGSVLGEIFSRRMLLHLLQSDSQVKIARAVAKLFERRVLECEGGDFTRDTSMVLIHPAPVAIPVTKPYCSCLGTIPPPNCQHLPMYAFCGLMKFRHALFRKTTYELLTDNQKNELHGRALLYLERYTRRCLSCGSGCFVQLFGVRTNDGMIPESKKVKRVRQQISALAAETRMTTGSISPYMGILDTTTSSVVEDENRETQKRQEDRRTDRVRTFSSLEIASCECMPILLSVYHQVIDHCIAVGECNKLFETYMEFCDISLSTLNIPQAIRLLMQAEEFLNGTNNKCSLEMYCQLTWIRDMRMARVLTGRGACMLENGETAQAERHLLEALKLYHISFPTTSVGISMKDACETVQLHTTMYATRLQMGVERGYRARFYEAVSCTLGLLYKMFTIKCEFKKAALAAKWAMNYQWKSNGNFKCLCDSYADIISVYKREQKFSKCIKLKKMALEVCHRKKGQLDVTEVPSVVALYSSIFLFYAEFGKKAECLEFGLSVIPLLTSSMDTTATQSLMRWMLQLLLCDLRLHEMVLIMREFFYMTEHYDLSSETWYYYFSILILLDTGYCVETYGACEKFYIRIGDAIFRSKTPEAAWNYFVVMWLVTVRVGAWERSILWEEKIQQLYSSHIEKVEFNNALLVRLVEGLLITLVKEIDKRNVSRILTLITSVELVLKQIKKKCNRLPIYRPRYYLMLAYYKHIRGNKNSAFSKLNKALEIAKTDGQGHQLIRIWIEHTRKHWKGKLDEKLVNFWADHIEADNLLDYTQFDPRKLQFVPYTLPLPDVVEF